MGEAALLLAQDADGGSAKLDSMVEDALLNEAEVETFVLMKSRAAFDEDDRFSEEVGSSASDAGK